MSHKRGRALAGVVAACLLLSSCGGGGGGGGGGGQAGSNAPPFPTASEDQLPAGTRIDVSAKNLFQMGAGDSWQYTVLNAGGNAITTATRRVISGPDSSGRVSITDDDGGPSTTTYVVSADGLLDESPLGSDAPASAASIVGALFEYATPLYPVGAERRHVRSGPWGADLDGDGIGESFRLEITQVFLGFETARLSSFLTLNDVAHFRNVITLTLRPTTPGYTDYTLIGTEETWFAPGLGLVKALRSIADSEGVTVDPLHTLLFSSGFVAGVNWNVQVPPPPVLDGTFVDVPLVHNALVYDSARNKYYASVPGSVIGNGNSIATIDPVTAQVTYSAPVGSEPNALALAADASVLYVGIDGSGDVAKLALPSMAEQGRVKLISDMFFGQSRAETIAVSPADPTVAAVSMAWSGVSPRHAGVALLRNLVMQPNRTQVHTGSNLITFDATGSTLYGQNTETTEFGLRRIQVLADGLVQDLVVPATTGFGTRGLAFVGNRVVTGRALYDAPALTAAGLISRAGDCTAQRSGSLLLCFGAQDFNTGQAHLLIADPDTFVIKGSLLYALSEPITASRRLVEGPAGQVAIGYALSGPGSVSKVRLFSSAQLLTPPTPPAVAWPVTSSSTADGQALDVGITHNALVYDSVRNLYYASVPGSVIGSGNSIATIDPATGQVTHSAPVGSEPNALAIAADASVLYVGIDGSGDVAKLALPSMAELGRVKLVTDPFFGQSHAETIAVSPADATVAAVSMAWSGSSPRHAGVALLRDLVMQPKRTQRHTGSNLITFDAAGATLYGQNNESTEFGLRRIQVLADGLVQDLVVTAAPGSGRALSFAGNRVVSGRSLYDTQALTVAGAISGASDCWAQRSGTQLLCLSDFSAPGRVLVASSATFVIGASLVYATSEQDTSRRLVQGPADQVAVSYTSIFSTPKIRLFSSAQLP